MADANVIRSFLVSLGFKVDEAGNKKFNEGIDKATKNVDRLARGLTLMAVATVSAVKTYGEQMQRLYYSSQLSGASAQNLSALRFGFSQIGLSADQASGAIGNMAQSMVANPGLRGLMNNLLGEDTSKMDTVKVFMAFLDKLKGMQPYVAMQYGQKFGIDPAALRQMMMNVDALKEAVSQYRSEQEKAGINDKNTSEQGKRLARAWGEMRNKVDNLTKALNENFYPIAMKVLGWGNDFLDVLVRLNKETGGWSTGIASVVALFASWKAAAWGLKSILGSLGIGGGEAAAGAAKTGILGRIFPFLSRLLGGVGLMTYSSGLNSGEDEWVRKHLTPPKSPATQAVETPQPLGLRHNNPGNLMPGGNIASYQTMGEGLRAMASQLHRYMERGQDTIRKIIYGTGKYGGYSATDRESYVANLVKMLHTGADQKLNLNDPGQLAQLMGAMIRVEQGKNTFSNAQLLAAASGVTVNQTTNIKVYGGDRETARDVELAQQRVNAQLAKNLEVAVR